jgi:hypothetical protein
MIGQADHRSTDMDHASSAITEDRPIPEAVAHRGSVLGQQHLQVPEHPGAARVAVAVASACIAVLVLFGCASDGGVSDATTLASSSRSPTSTSGTSAVAPEAQLAVPVWATELVDLPPGRVTRVDDTSTWYVAEGYFDDVVALLVEQLGEPAPVHPTRCTLAQLCWHLDRGSVMAVATPSLRWNLSTAIIGFSRNDEVAEVRCSGGVEVGCS